MNWTPDYVLARLIDAYSIIEATTSPAGPRQYGKSLPGEMVLDKSDRYTGDRPDEDMKIEKELRLNRSAKQSASISMAQEADQWTRDHVKNDMQRDILIEYATRMGNGKEWTPFIVHQCKGDLKLFEAYKRKYYRARILAQQQIADALNNTGS